MLKVNTSSVLHYTIMIFFCFSLDSYLSSESGHHDWNVGPWQGQKVDMKHPQYEINLKNSTVIYVSERVGVKK